MTTSTPTPEAIEAAARASFERDNSESWEEAAPSIKDEFYADATAALTAAAPFIAAQAKGEAWDEGYDDCWDFNQSAGQIGRDTNPYRAATIEGKNE